MARTKEEIENIVNDLGYLFIDEYMKNKIRNVIVRDKYGYKYDVNLSSLLRFNSVEFVGTGNPFSLENISLFIIINSKEFELCENNKYEGHKHKLKLHCTKDECLEIFYANWDSIKGGRGCPFCRGLKVGRYNNLSYRRPDLKNEWDYKKNYPITPENITCGSNKIFWWICSNIECSFSWKASVSHRTSMKSGCPRCNISKGESSISKYLDRIVEYKTQIVFNECKDKRVLPFDFYLPDYNLCVEYHGIHHYEPVRFSYSISEERAIENLKNQKKRDRLKIKYCKENNIKLLIIPYWDFDNIDQILEQNLFG